MDLQWIVSISGVTLSVGLALHKLTTGMRSLPNWAFAGGMLALASEEILYSLHLHSSDPSAALGPPIWSVLAGDVALGCWLLFSQSFARENYQAVLSRRKWLVGPFILAPLAMSAFFFHSFFTGNQVVDGFPDRILRLSRPGYYHYVAFLLGVVMVLAGLESTLRASWGAQRWRIKFTLLGVVTFYFVRVYSVTEALLFSFVGPNFFISNGFALVAGNLLILISTVRDRLQNVRVYVSQEMLHGSITVMVVGLYLLGVGLMAKAAILLKVDGLFLHKGLVLLLSVMGTLIILLSEDVRARIRRFIHKHFRHPKYDYRTVWSTLTQRTASVMDRRDLCSAVVKMAAETFGVSSVSIWGMDGATGQPVLLGSTALSTNDVGGLEREISVLMMTMVGEKLPVDLERCGLEGAGGSAPWETKPDNDRTLRYCAPMSAGGQFLGVITLNGRTEGEAFTMEDLELLKTLSDQTAGILLNHELYESLGRAREMEAFQSVSTFFVHDLKNLASTLSLTLQNLPIHYEDPDFRQDALRIMATSVEKIRAMCSRLSMLAPKHTLELCPCNLDEIVRSSIADLGATNVQVGVSGLANVPNVLIDPEQMKKVLMNLFLNAIEASETSREVRVEARSANGRVVLSVSDSGCGMSREFMEQSLFRPFKTTKERGMGIGLYQCKTIIEAHRGKIEVESCEGHGTTFRVLVPVAEAPA